MESNTVQTQRMNLTISVTLWAVESFHISGESFTTDRMLCHHISDHSGNIHLVLQVLPMLATAHHTVTETVTLFLERLYDPVIDSTSGYLCQIIKVNLL